MWIRAALMGASKAMVRQYLMRGLNTDIRIGTTRFAGGGWCAGESLPGFQARTGQQPAGVKGDRSRSRVVRARRRSTYRWRGRAQYRHPHTVRRYRFRTRPSGPSKSPTTVRNRACMFARLSSRVWTARVMAPSTSRFHPVPTLPTWLTDATTGVRSAPSGNSQTPRS